MAESDPRMLPGIPASLAAGVAALTLVALGLTPVLLAVASIVVHATTHWTQRTGLTFLAIAGVSFAVAAIIESGFLPYSRLKRRRELDAGYTTLLREFNQVDGISWRTGVVVRPAVEASGGYRPADRFTSGDEADVADLGHGPLRASLSMPGFLVATSCSLVALFVGTIWFAGVLLAQGSDRPAGATAYFLSSFFLAFAGLCGVACAFMVYFVFYIPRRYLARVATHFAHARVFMGVPDNSDLTSELLGAQSPAVAHAAIRGDGFLRVGQGFVAVEPESIVLLSRYRRSVIPYLVIPRSSIEKAKVGTTSSYWASGLPYPDVTLAITKDNGTTLNVQLRLALTKGGPRSAQIRNDCQWIVDWASRPQPAAP